MDDNGCVRNPRWSILPNIGQGVPSELTRQVSTDYFRILNRITQTELNTLIMKVVSYFIIILAAFSCKEVKNYNLNYTKQEPIIDGVIDEIWNKSCFNYLKNIGKGEVFLNDSTDLSAKFCALWDDKYFYIICKVKDDKIISDCIENGEEYKIIENKKHYKNNDAITLYFDINNTKLPIKYKTITEPGYYQFAFIIGCSNVFGELTTQNGLKILECNNLYSKEIDYQINIKDKMYILEARIPWKILGYKPIEGKYIGFDIKIFDKELKMYDNYFEGVRETILQWGEKSESFSANIPGAWGNIKLIGIK